MHCGRHANLLNDTKGADQALGKSNDYSQQVVIRDKTQHNNPYYNGNL